MKKKMFKKWIQNVLIYVSLICFMLMSAESDNLMLDVITKLALMGILLINTYLLKKHSNLLD